VGDRIPALNPSVTEITTGATGALLGTVVILALVALRRVTPPSPRRTVWTAAFTAFASAAFLGTVVHGLDLAPALNQGLWQPLYLLLGLALALFTVGAQADWRGWESARHWLPFALAGAAGFYVMTLIRHGDYLVFVLFEGAALLWALGVYLSLARARRPGATMMALGLLLSIVAGALQASTLRVTIGWPFDHNSLYHVGQLGGVLALMLGLRELLRTPSR
jgi:hypothetical protein